MIQEEKEKFNQEQSRFRIWLQASREEDHHKKQFLQKKIQQQRWVISQLELDLNQTKKEFDKTKDELIKTQENLEAYLKQRKNKIHKLTIQRERDFQEIQDLRKTIEKKDRQLENKELTIEKMEDKLNQFDQKMERFQTEFNTKIEKARWKQVQDFVFASLSWFRFYKR